MRMPLRLGISMSIQAGLEGLGKILGLSRGRHKHTIPQNRDDLSVIYRHSTQPSQEEINQACALIIEAERRSFTAEIKATLQA